LAELEELRAIRRERSDGMTRDLAEVLHELATVRMDVGDHEGARELLVRVLDFTEKSLEPYDALALAARTTLIEAWLAQERYDRARAEGLTLLRELGSYSESATRQSTREARAIGHAIQGRVPVLLSLALRDPKDQELQRQVFEIVESARGLSVARPADRADDGDARLRWIRERLNDLVAAATDETDEESLRELRELSDERDRLQRERHEVDSRPSRSALLDTQNLAEALPEGSAAVGFLRTSLGLDPSCPQHLVAGVLRPDGTVTYIDLGRAHDLEARVRDWRVAIGRPFAATRGVIAPPKSAAPPTPSQAAAGTELTRHIVGPVLRATGNASRLHICLDDFLCSLPLDALPSEGKLVGDHVRLLVESSFARLVEPRRPLRRASPPRLCLLGAIDYGAAQEASSTLESRSISRSFADLPGAAAEVSSVDRLFQTRFGLPAIVLRGDAATAARFRENVVDARFVHVATHAWFAGPSDLGVAAGTDDTSSLLAGMAPLTLSGLAMSGANLGRDDLGRPIGILTAEELAGFDLSSCELAFLSACDTGVGVRGAGQVTQSLQAALSAAGARATITTLWPVDDRCTQELVKHFYEGIWERDLGRADALWRAKRRLRDEGHPVHAWAGFVLTGEP